MQCDGTPNTTTGNAAAREISFGTINIMGKAERGRRSVEVTLGDSNRTKCVDCSIGRSDTGGYKAGTKQQVSIPGARASGKEGSGFQLRLLVSHISCPESPGGQTQPLLDEESLRASIIGRDVFDDYSIILGFPGGCSVWRRLPLGSPGGRMRVFPRCWIIGVNPCRIVRGVSKLKPLPGPPQPAGHEHILKRK
jgi:hypothetical protein